MFDHSKRQSFFVRCFTCVERHIKVTLLDCSMCGQCIVRSCALVCPMRCPKQMRNGPCGGSVRGRCEVDTTKPCAWYKAHERARKWRRWLGKWGAGMADKLEKTQPPVDWRLWGTAAWLNCLKGVTDWDGHVLPPKSEGGK